MEQATDDNQGGRDARLRGEGHVERSLLVSCAEMSVAALECYPGRKPHPPTPTKSPPLTFFPSLLLRLILMSMLW